MAMTVGIRELQQHASQLVRDVENGIEYHITVQGRDTDVMLTKTSAMSPRTGVSAAEAMNSAWWKRELPEATRQRLLAGIEAGREASGYVGE